jgi:catechol 2,3-dioxygenase-like lactoylglutathione lyase family enzyme
VPRDRPHRDRRRRITLSVQGFVWLGVRTPEIEAMTALFRDVLQAQIAERAPDFVRFQFPNRDQLELFGPSMEGQAHLTTGPMPEFLVDDVEETQVQLEAAGIEILRPVTFWRSDYGSLHFRGPDGNVYGLLSGPYYD